MAAASTLPARAMSACAESGGIDYSRRLEVKHETDVFIAGGGPAGVAAAISAAENGARVFLAEGHSCFGGMSTAGRVPVFMRFGDGVNVYSQGVATRVREALKAETSLQGEGHDIEAFKRAYDSLMASSGATFLLGVKVVDAIADRGTVRYAVCSAPSGMFAVKAKVFIDATGNGELAFAAGAQMKKGNASGRTMPGTLCSLWTGFDWNRWQQEAPKHPKTFRGWADFIDAAISDGVFLEPDRHLTGFNRLGKDLATANMGHAFNLDATDERSVTRALVRCRAQMKEWERYFHEYVKRGTEDIRLVATGELLGVREARRLVAEYTLNFDDYMKRAKFKDEIGRYSYSIDIHPSDGSKDGMSKFAAERKAARYSAGESYGIPYRSLVARGFSNLLAAGRCIGTDELVQSSVRVIPCCYITGQAAGTAAALAAKTGVNAAQVNIGELQSSLRAHGAYLPA